MRRYSFIILSLFLCLGLFAQDKDITQTLLQISNTTGLDRVKALNQASHFYKLNKPDTALLLSQQALHEYGTANELVLLSEIYGNLAESYFYLAKQDSAVAYYLKAIAIAEQLNNRKKMASFYNGLGTSLYQLEKFEKAIEYMKKAATIKLEDGDLLYYSVINANIAAALQRLSKFNEAILILKNSEKQLLNFKNVELLANVYNSIGSVYLFDSDIKNLDSAAKYFNKNIQLISKPEHEAYRLAAYVNLATVFIEQKKYEDAEINLSKALTLSTKLSRHQERLQVYDQFSKLYEQKGAYKEALQYKNLFNTLHDSILTNENSETINNLESQYQLEKKDLKIKQQELLIENEKYKSRVFIILLILVIVIALAVTYTLLLRKRTRETIQKEKTRFFSNVVHEFRTPLTLLKGPVEELKKHTTTQESRENISLIERGSERLMLLVNQLLDVSKIEAGKFTITKQYGSLISAIEPLLIAFKKQTDDKMIRFNAQLQITEGNYLFSTDAIEKIISNLISNAIKHTPSGESINTTIVLNTDLSLNITVKDTGSGISKKDLPHVFERFYQSNNAKQAGGTGLGLSLTKELVELMQGQISISSELNKGTEVKVTIPIEKAQVKLVDSNTIKEDDFQIVLVEDDNELANFTSGILKAEGFVVHTVNNGSDAVQLIQTLLPDIIISDIMMPGMSGTELASIIKKTPIIAHIPIIGLSAKNSQTGRIEALDKGMDVYIAKPFHPDELILVAKNFVQTIRKNQQLYEQQVKEDTKPYLERICAEDAYLNKVVEVLNQHIDDSEFSVNELSDALCISRSQLHRKIKSLTGFSTTYFIKMVRLEKAKDMLKMNQGNVTEIAYSCGFNSQSYFTKSFIEYFGSSPSSFMK